MNDTGGISGAKCSFLVEDVQSFGGYILHIGHVSQGIFSVGNEVVSEPDFEERSNIAPNHTMTHVLNLALRKVLGGDGNQKGSLVDSKKRGSILAMARRCL